MNELIFLWWYVVRRVDGVAAETVLVSYRR